MVSIISVESLSPEHRRHLAEVMCGPTISWKFITEAVDGIHLRHGLCINGDRSRDWIDRGLRHHGRCSEVLHGLSGLRETNGMVALEFSSPASHGPNMGPSETKYRATGHITSENSTPYEAHMICKVDPMQPSLTSAKLPSVKQLSLFTRTDLRRRYACAERTCAENPSSMYFIQLSNLIVGYILFIAFTSH